MLKNFVSEPVKATSDFAKEFDFNELRPYYDAEVGQVMERISKEPLYIKLMAYLWKDLSPEQAVEKARQTHSLYEFQTGYMSHAIWSIVKASSTGLTWSGINRLDPDKAYLYIANHRDILLDSAILQIILEAEHFSTSEITFGSNLMEQGFITDFGRMNRMFTVKREGTSKELYDISRNLSAYIRHTILDKTTSVWIAQRNGRTKDGSDQTQTGLLKMLNMSGGSDFVKDFSQLNIVPLTISFEYEPCDAAKVQELYLSSLHTKYVKAPGEDMNSIITGITQPKGKIHMAFGKPIQQELSEIDRIGANENEKIKLLAALIDTRIHNDYKLQHVNYIAYDVVHRTDVFANTYTPEEHSAFLNYVERNTEKLSGEPEVLRQYFFRMYANPVINKLNLKN